MTCDERLQRLQDHTVADENVDAQDEDNRAQKDEAGGYSVQKDQTELGEDVCCMMQGILWTCSP